MHIIRIRIARARKIISWIWIIITSRFDFCWSWLLNWCYLLVQIYSLFLFSFLLPSPYLSIFESDILISPRRRDAIDCIARLNSDSMCNDSSLRFRSEDLDGIIGVLRIGTHCSSSLFDHLSSRLLSRLARLFIRLAVRGRLRFVDRYDSSFTVLLRGWCSFLIHHDLYKVLMIQ